MADKKKASKGKSTSKAKRKGELSERDTDRAAGGFDGGGGLGSAFDGGGGLGNVKIRR